jgi:hypothetical protein
MSLRKALSLTILWLVGTLGVSLPLVFPIQDANRQHGLLFSLLTGMSVGVMLGIAWLHLLTDSQDAFIAALTHGCDGSMDLYSFANLSMLAGCLLMALIDCAVSRPRLEMPHTAPTTMDRLTMDTDRNVVLLGGDAAHLTASKRKVVVLETAILVHLPWLTQATPSLHHSPRLPQATPSLHHSPRLPQAIPSHWHCEHPGSSAIISLTVMITGI